MTYFIIAGVLFVISVIVCHKMNILDIYLLAISYAVILLSLIYGFIFSEPWTAFILLLIGVILIVSVKIYRSRQVI